MRKAIAMLVDSSIAAMDRWPMAYGNHPKPGDGVPEVVKQEEGRRLHALWKRHAKRSQAAFLSTLDLSGGYFPQFFKGMRPITLELAEAIAEELDVEIREFSPRLAGEIEKLMEGAQWPFRDFTRAEYISLTPEQRHAVEALISGFLRANGAFPTRRLRSVR
jgi:transcriptional regulator with XRE-family HTH domain